MRDRMRVRPDGWPSADDAPTGPIPRIAVPTELPRPQADASAQVPTSGHHPARVLVIIGLAQLMVVLDTTIVNIALPSAQSALGFDTESRQWIVTAYSLAFGALLLSGGRLSDIVGRRRTLLIGLVGFAAASAVGGAAVGFGMLVAARAAQGVFAAILAPAALSTLNVTFTGGRERGRAFGTYAAIASGGAVVGLLLGGALTEWLSWRWCLYVNLLFAVPAAALVSTSLPAKDVVAAKTRQFDWPGVLAVSGGLFCIVYGLSNAQTDSWTAPLTISMFVTSAVLLALFVPIEIRAPKPLLPLHIVADRNRVGSYLAIGLAFCSMFGVFLFLTYYLQQTLRYSPLMTGVAFLPFAAGIAVAAGVSNTALVPRFGPRPLVPAGMAIAAAGMFWLRHLNESSSYAGSVLVPLIVLGLGVGLTFAPAIATATAALPDDDAGVGSAMVNTSQQIGGAVGTAVLSTIFTSTLIRYMGSHPPGPQAQSAAAIHGYTVAFSVACGLFLVGAVTTAALLRSGRLPTEPAGEEPAAADDVDVAALQRRIAELETDNRHLQEQLHIRTVAASTPR
ncbi:MAG TPA: MFS transporter [Mycobacterium sp.]|jgi:EmrB/QacA subfamily drug resistance transporter|nr:MFS transporter [Mycobacterium sp.]